MYLTLFITFAKYMASHKLQQSNLRNQRKQTNKQTKKPNHTERLTNSLSHTLLTWINVYTTAAF